MISFAIYDFPEPGNPLSIITILDGLLYRPGGHNSVSMLNNCRSLIFLISLIFDIFGGDGVQIFISISSCEFSSFSLLSKNIVESIVVNCSSFLISSNLLLLTFVSFTSVEKSIKNKKY